MSKSTKQLFSDIEAYLATPKKSDGGWAPVEPAEMDALRDILAGLLTLKYEKDPDGDLPVSYQLTDKTRYERPVQLTIRNPASSLHSSSEAQLYLEGAQTAAVVASHYAEKASRYAGIGLNMIQDAVTAQQPVPLFGATLQASPPEGVTVDSVKAALVVAVKAAIKRMPCPVEFNERQAWAKRCADDASVVTKVNVVPKLVQHVHNGVKLSFEVPIFDARIYVTPEDVALPAKRVSRKPSASASTV